MVDFPNIFPAYKDLPNDLDSRREALIEILGQHICWSRELALARIRERIESAVESQKSPEDAWIATLAAEQRSKMLAFAMESMDILVKFLLALLANRGFDLKLDANHVVWYKLISEIYDTDTDKVVDEVILNRDQVEFLPDYLHGWLDRYAKSSK